ncbi:hypothetical protein PVAND_006046 [Polypedilum vanderplanki]|uniref:ABC transporter domain-containing protein n=1 Tax=Polypedilum vanderplanki TaxID=319348 RepID=A0A9J6C2T7_POLVA|nr:hypothetical protein PVAND_006046 [Polypedilum vanderplanki]
MSTGSSSSFDEILVESELRGQDKLKYLPHWPAVNITFEDVVYTVDSGVDNSKSILRGVNGSFKSGQLVGILGPSGAGKTTLLNTLAGFKCENVTTGSILINNKPRNMKVFRRMSRYIMQQDIHQVALTVRDVMMYAADLKLGFKDLTKEQKAEIVEEIIHLLGLEKTMDTDCSLLSGGELKRLSIAQELVNNPPVLFLDEPTTGLDDMSSSQCVELLKRLASGGRTVICSIHTPSAKIFEMFDQVYVVANGQCVFNGKGSNIVPYMEAIGLRCPKTYNPADFILDVASGEYGHEFLDRMVEMIDNGRIVDWKPQSKISDSYENSYNADRKQSSELDYSQFEEEINPNNLEYKCSSWQQFSVLFRRASKQIYNNKSYLALRLNMHIFLGIVVGGIFYQMGNDATKTIFNFGFCFTIIIAFMYIPLLPVLLEFPTQVQLLKREYFNHWYQFNPYYFAMVVAKLPVQFFIAILYLTMVYLLTNQPIELQRIFIFYFISLLTSLTSESFGLLVSSRLSIINAMFIGPVLVCPMMLLSVYGIGSGKDTIPPLIQIFMKMSYLRHSLEGIVQSIYGFGRQDMVCPNEEVFCPYKKPAFLLRIMGFEDLDLRISILYLFGFYVMFNAAAVFLIKDRLSYRRNQIWPIQYISKAVKHYMNYL